MTPMEAAKDAALRSMYGPGLLKKVKEHGGDPTMDLCAEAAVTAHLKALAEDEETVERVARATGNVYWSIKATCTPEQDVDQRAVARAALLALAKDKT